MTTTEENLNTAPVFIILDGNAIVHRSYHAIRPLHTAQGVLVNAVYGFTSILLTIMLKEKPDYIVSTFDTGAPTFRHEAFTEYKANREKAPDELISQLKLIYNVLTAFKIPILKQEGVEADDIIGTLVKHNEENSPQLQNKIISGDMDLMQLVSSKTCVSTLHKGYQMNRCFFPEQVEEKYGISPHQVTDYKGLCGDSSDNIPGVRGIGKVGAVSLLSQYQNLEGIYKHINEINGKKREYLVSGKESAFFSRELATLKCDVNINFKKEDARSQDFSDEEVLQLFQQLDFHSLSRRFKSWRNTHGLEEQDLMDVFSSPIKKQKIIDPNQSRLF